MNCKLNLEKSSVEGKHGQRYYGGTLCSAYNPKHDGPSTLGQMAHDKFRQTILINIAEFRFLSKKFRPNLDVILTKKYSLSFVAEKTEKGWIAKDILIEPQKSLHTSLLEYSLLDYLKLFVDHERIYCGGIVSFVYADHREGQLVHDDIPMHIRACSWDFVNENGLPLHPNLQKLRDDKDPLSFLIVVSNDGACAHVSSM